VDARPGTLIFVQPELRRTAVAAEPDTVVLAVGGDALEHLHRSIEGYPPNAEYARADPDFDAIRDDPRFPG
jgi:hypothetical protein